MLWGLRACQVASGRFGRGKVEQLNLCRTNLSNEFNNQHSSYGGIGQQHRLCQVEKMKEEIVIPASDEPLILDATFFGPILPKQIESDMA